MNSSTASPLVRIYNRAEYQQADPWHGACKDWWRYV